MKKYSETHEWVELEGDVAVVGISQHAQTLLGDIAFLELPAVGTEFKQGEPLGVIESVKSASDFYAPISGVVVEVNQDAVAQPGKLNGQAESTWLLKLKCFDLSEIKVLISADSYQVE
jgi:glycine cleavage system H protein